MITQQLAEITVADTTPLLPSSLNTTNEVLTAVIDALEQVGNGTETAVTNEVNDLKAKILYSQFNTACIIYSACCGCL